MDMLKELWYGNISPFEQCTRGNQQWNMSIILLPEIKN